MRLKKNSLSLKDTYNELLIRKISPEDKVIALAGNPNVGKSTLFNALTGLNQHTGNWAGKTVLSAQGKCLHNNKNYFFIDLPGTYSLMARSAEEEVARNFICFGESDVAVVVCDATCLERNLNLVIQTLEITNNVIVCINFIDEAEKKHIKIDHKMLSEILGVPVILTAARDKKGVDALLEEIEIITEKNEIKPNQIMRYTNDIENVLSIIKPFVNENIKFKSLNSRWISLNILTKDEKLIKKIEKYVGFDFCFNTDLLNKKEEVNKYLLSKQMTLEKLKDNIISCIVLKAEEIAIQTISFGKDNYNKKDRIADKILTSKSTGIPIMLALLCLVFWLTIVGANYPSQLLSQFFNYIEISLLNLAKDTIPTWLSEPLILGAYKVLAWVVAVMLPPMAIFFPLFSLLEDLGYLPRIAFNLDKYFKKVNACGKQALTMCMGFGCNAAGVVGCRIIDSPRERLVAILTNNFIICNGRFPILITIISIFFIGTESGFFNTFLSAIVLMAVIIMGVLMTLFISKILSDTILKGTPSSFTLELPPYRLPQIKKVLIRSIFDRTLFVLGRAAAVAAPAGLIIWISANFYIGDSSILSICSNFLDPFAKIIGLDGVILTAFILGFPANEIVLPIIIMAYMASGGLQEISLGSLKLLLVNNGWTWVTAVCTMVFSLMHWPCSTTCLTIKKETNSLKWMLVSIVVPTVSGILMCFIIATGSRLLNLVL